MSTTRLKYLSIFLGILMLSFGLLKFFQPIRGWFDSQAQLSHLPPQSVIAGKIGEIVTGCLFLLPWTSKSMKVSIRAIVLLIASASLVVQMVTAIYVHLQPQVPASVLPLGIKPPFIPAFVLILALVTGFSVWKDAVSVIRRPA